MDDSYKKIFHLITDAHYIIQYISSIKVSTYIINDMN